MPGKDSVDEANAARTWELYQRVWQCQELERGWCGGSDARLNLGGNL